MHNAPSVNYPVGRCRFQARVLLLLALLGGVVLVTWWTTPSHPEPAHRLTGVAGGLLWLLWMAWATWTWPRSAVGQLRWEALASHASRADHRGVWRWHAESAAEPVPLQGAELAVDLQSLALLRLHGLGNAGSLWVWVERRQDPAQWNALRRSLQSATG